MTPVTVLKIFYTILAILVLIYLIPLCLLPFTIIYRLLGYTGSNFFQLVGILYFLAIETCVIILLIPVIIDKLSDKDKPAQQGQYGNIPIQGQIQYSTINQEPTRYSRPTMSYTPLTTPAPTPPQILMSSPKTSVQNISQINSLINDVSNNVVQLDGNSQIFIESDKKVQ
jgi:hypothetical protein